MFQMKSSLLRYVLYYAVQLLNFLDRTILILFQRRLQTFRKADFLKSVPCSVLKELEDPDVSEPVFLNIEGLQREHKLSAFIRLEFVFLLIQLSFILYTFF